MPITRTLQRSFAGGEVTHEFYGRIDDVKYQSGLAKCRNFIAYPHGPVANRAGTYFVREVADSAKKARLIPFTYSTAQTMAIEFSEGTIRFHTRGATLLGGKLSVLTNSFFMRDLSDWTSSAPDGTVDWYDGLNGNAKLIANTGSVELSQEMSLTTDVEYTIRLGVISSTLSKLEILDSAGTAVLSETAVKNHKSFTYTPSVTDTFTIKATQDTADGEVRLSYITVTGEATDANAPLEVDSPYREEDLFDLHYVQSADILTLVHPSYEPRELRRKGSDLWDLVTINFAASIDPPTSITAVASGHSTAKYDYTYCVTTVDDTGVSESVASASKTVKGNLLETGGIVTISWPAVSGASRYNVYKLQGGVFGYVGESETTSVVDDNIAPDLGKTPPTYDTVFNESGSYPGAVSYFEQRRIFAGTSDQPQNIWMTRSGTESDMSYSLPIKDDDRIAFRVAAREANTIRHIVPLTEMVLLTSSAEWRVTSVNSDAITPSSISVKPQSYVGASNVQPIIVNNSLLYGAARGAHIRELGYNWQANGYITGDLSIRAPHLFDQFLITDMGFSKAPYPVAWFIRNDGSLLGLTYMPEQQIGSWHQHDTEDGNAFFESVCVIAEDDDDVAYFVVRREIDGYEVRYIERMPGRWFPDLENAFFVDCGGTYNGINNSADTMTASGGVTWDNTEHVTLTCSADRFNVSGSDVGDAVVLTDSEGQKFRMKIISVNSTTEAVAQTDKTLSVELRETATANWSFARNQISNLDWLEGKTVSILADGAVHPQRVVTNGEIFLDAAASIVQIGLPITADLQTLPLSLNIEGYGQGRWKNVNNIFLRVSESSGVFAGPTVDTLTEYKQRTTEPYGTPPYLKSQELRLMVSPSWNDSAQIWVRQSDPLPITLVNMSLEVSLGS